MSFWKRRATGKVGSITPDASRLDTRVTLQAPNHLPDGAGGYTPGWDTVATVWAEIIPLSALEERKGKQAHSIRFYRVVMRYRDDLSPNQCLLVGDEILHIRGVVSVGRKRWLEVFCDTGGMA
jgi:SPP1 family predicted phage head-tail adaptor